MSYQLVITQAAETDMTEICTYISLDLHAPESALALLDKIDCHILSLEHMPKRFALVSDEKLARLGIRLIPVKNYLIFYFVDDYKEAVTIVRVLYSKRDWVNLLSVKEERQSR